MRTRSVISWIVFGFAIAASTAALAQDKPPDSAGNKPAADQAPEAPPSADAPADETPTAEPTATTTAPPPTAPPAELPPATPPPSTTPAAGTAPAVMPAPVSGPAYTSANPPPTGEAGGEKTDKSVPPPESAFGIQFDFGAMGRLDSGGDLEKGGLTFGPSVWLSPMRMFAVGLGYQRVRAGVDQEPNAVGGLDVQRDLNLLWVFGRYYPVRSDSVGMYLTLGLGGAWQHVDANGARVEPGLVQPAAPYSCSGSAGPAFAIGGGPGLDLDVGHDWSFITEADLTTYRNSSDQIGSCAKGTGPMSSLGVRIGFAYRFDLGAGPAKTARARTPARF
jgi:hypothetical protein